MISNSPSVIPLLMRVFHPSDFSEASNTAFAHALAIALSAKAKLTLLHVSEHRENRWTDFPGVRDTLTQWNLLPKNSGRADVAELGIEVQKVLMVHDDPVESITTYLEEHGADLTVLATDQHKSGVRWLHRSVALDVARKSREMMLFIPKGIAGFVSLESGRISLKHIVIPVALAPSPEPAVHAAARLVSGLRCDPGILTLLHVGEEETMPQVMCPELTGWRWNRITRSGEVADVIAQVVKDIDADLIVMTTEGPHGVLDALCGSHSEQILQESLCPVLTIPAKGFLSAVL